MRVVIALALGAVAVLSACGPTRAYFKPTDNIEQTRRGAQARAVYPIVDAEGQQVGEVKVSSQGIYEVKQNDRKIVALHQELTVSNASRDLKVQVPYEEVFVNLPGGVSLKPDQIFSDASGYPVAKVAPSTVDRFDFLFYLPKGVSPGDIDDFFFHWSIVSGRERLTHFTEFARIEPEDYYYPAGVYLGYRWGYFYPGFWYIADPYPLLWSHPHYGGKLELHAWPERPVPDDT